MANEPKPQGHRVEIVLGRCFPYKHAAFKSILSESRWLSYTASSAAAVFVLYFPEDHYLEEFKQDVLVSFTNYAKQEGVSFQLIHSLCNISTFHP